MATRREIEEVAPHARTWTVLLGLWLALAVAAYAFAAPRIGPAEDAAILYLYSENLADTGVISYYAGGPPAEGATDFLWMVLLAGLHKIGLDTHLAASLLSGAAHLATAWLVMRLAGGRDRRLFFCTAFGLFLLPAFWAALLGFSPLVFGFFVLLDALWFVEGRPSALAVTALCTCLIRPDGVFFVAPLLAAFLLLERGRRMAVLKHFLLLLVLPGVAYFAWRRAYFEQWLPLPFYVKSGRQELLGLFERSALLVNLRTIAFLAPVIALAVWKLGERPAPERARVLALLIALILIPALAYSTFELSQNIGQRFQYPMVLAGLALPAVRRDDVPKRVLYPAVSAMSVLAMLPSSFLMALYAPLKSLECSPAIARDLAPLSSGRTMAVTEAGRLPYYSRWKCLDLWGLNTPDYARRAVTAADLEREEPDLIVLHSSPVLYRQILEEAAGQREEPEHTWRAMLWNACAFAVHGGYELLMVPYVRDLPEDGWLAALAGVAARLDPELDLSGRHEMYFLAPRSDCREKLGAVLRAHGALTFDEYSRKLRAGRAR